MAGTAATVAGAAPTGATVATGSVTSAPTTTTIPADSTDQVLQATTTTTETENSNSAEALSSWPYLSSIPVSFSHWLGRKVDSMISFPPEWTFHGIWTSKSNERRFSKVYKIRRLIDLNALKLWNRRSVIGTNFIVTNVLHIILVFWKIK